MFQDATRTGTAPAGGCGRGPGDQRRPEMHGERHRRQRQRDHQRPIPQRPGERQQHQQRQEQPGREHLGQRQQPAPPRRDHLDEGEQDEQHRVRGQQPAPHAGAAAGPAAAMEGRRGRRMPLAERSSSAGGRCRPAACASRPPAPGSSRLGTGSSVRLGVPFGVRPVGDRAAALLAADAAVAAALDRRGRGSRAAAGGPHPQRHAEHHQPGQQQRQGQEPDRRLAAGHPGQHAGQQHRAGQRREHQHRAPPRPVRRHQRSIPLRGPRALVLHRPPRAAGSQPRAYRPLRRPRPARSASARWRGRPARRSRR